MRGITTILSVAAALSSFVSPSLAAPAPLLDLDLDLDLGVGLDLDVSLKIPGGLICGLRPLLHLCDHLPDCTCNNQGLAYAIQKNPYVVETSPYPNFDPTHFKTVAPFQQGYTNKLGYVNNNPSASVSIYGGAPIKTEYIVINHRGYFIPPKTGRYTVTFPQTDNISLLWLGPNAYNGAYTRANANLEQTIFSPLKTYTTGVLQAGRWYAIRIMSGNGAGPGSFQITMNDPSGNEILGPKTTDESPFFAQFSCDGRYPKYEPFGKET